MDIGCIPYVLWCRLCCNRSISVVVVVVVGAAIPCLLPTTHVVKEAFFPEATKVFVLVVHILDTFGRDPGKGVDGCHHIVREGNGARHVEVAWSWLDWDGMRWRVVDWSGRCCVSMMIGRDRRRQRRGQGEKEVL